MRQTTSNIIPNLCLIYSGYTRTYGRCGSNHAQMLGVDNHTHAVHRNEHTHNLEIYKNGIPEFETNKAPETVVVSTLNQWHNNYFAFKTAPRNFAVYVRMRYDIVLSERVDFSQYEYRDDVVYIASGNDYRDGVNDQFAFGSYKAMEAYYSVYENFREIFASGLYFHTETYLTRNLHNKGVRIIRVPVKTEIIR